MKLHLLATVFFTGIVLTVGTALADDVYLAVGPGGQRMFSQDGSNWEKHIAWGEPRHDQNDLNVVTFFQGTAYVGGGYFSARITATQDGVHWSEGELPKGSPIFGLEVLNDKLYVITLRGQVFQSTDGEQFQLATQAKMPSKTHWIRSTVTGNGIIVGSGDYGPVIAFDPKTEKITVTQMSGQTEKKATLRRVAFGNGLFVVGGQDGLLATSKDGINWQNNQTHPDRGDVSSVTWTGKQFVASTKSGPLASEDGVQWKSLPIENPRKMPAKLVKVGDWIYGWSWPPHRLQRSKDAVQWNAVPNPKEYHVKDIAFGTLAGQGDPPTLPQKAKRK